MIANLVSEASNSPEASIERAINNSSIYHFNSLLAVPSIKALSKSNPVLLKTLKVFAYGIVNDLPDEVKLPSDALCKLRQLSLITVATQGRQLKYADVMQSLRLSTVRELEDVVIEAIYNNLIKARLDSKHQLIEVDDWAARDAPSDVIQSMVISLAEWLQAAETVYEQTLNAAAVEDTRLQQWRQHMQNVDAEISAARKNLEETMMARETGPGRSRNARGSRSRAMPGNK